MRMTVLCLVLILTGLPIHKTFAQNKKTTEKKRTAVTFDDQLIEGEVKRPEFFYFLQKKQFNFGRLIKLRENFLPEMRKTGEAIERKRGTE